MNYSLIVLFSFSILIGSIIGWCRFRVINPIFFPFLYLVWLGLFNEIISLIITQHQYSNAVNNNIFNLLEAVCIAWLFKKWGLFTRATTPYLVIQTLFILSWVTENFFIATLHSFDSYFIILHDFVIVFMSISMLNKLIISERGKLLMNPMFLICMSFIIYFTYSVLVDTFWMYGLDASRSFRLRVYDILAFINLFANLIYALAILWMPTKPRYTLRS